MMSETDVLGQDFPPGRVNIVEGRFVGERYWSPVVWSQFMIDAPANQHTFSVVIPVYRGAQTLGALVDELESLTRTRLTPAGHAYRLAEVLLVWDGAIDNSAAVIRELASRHGFVTPIWLSRNYGQHPATLAGIASTSSSWVVTMDEDGQHDPAFLGPMLDLALDSGAQLVYGVSGHRAPHGFLRNAASRAVKTMYVSLLDSARLGRFSSFRLLWGEIARSIAAYCGSGVYLDIALSWVVNRAVRVPVRMRQEGRGTSGYNLPKLISHFWRLVLTSNTKPLRAIALLGFLAILFSLALSVFVVWQKLTLQLPIHGLATSIILMCFFGGAILFSLGVIAEYLAIAVQMAMGKPAYLIVSRPGPADPDR